jgi:hypothetical protein
MLFSSLATTNTAQVSIAKVKALLAVFYICAQTTYSTFKLLKALLILLN